MRYWGVEAWVPAAVARVCERLSPGYVEAIGLETPLWLPDPAAGGGDLPRLWLAGDDPSLLHRTMVAAAPGLGGKAREVRRMVTMAAYERHVAGRVDAAAAVSPADAAALRNVGGFRRVLLTPNGVDADYFRPTGAPADADTAVFWGRLDFPPNADAVTGFTRNVWPAVRERCPGARLRVVGRGATPAVVAACAAQGVELVGEVADVRPWIEAGAVAVLPMRSGAGIKNKLLEAAAMARPILASPRAVAGLTPVAGAPAWRVCAAPADWAGALTDLWGNRAAARRLGDSARRWVTAHHGWSSHAIARERFAGEAGSHGRGVETPGAIAA